MSEFFSTIINQFQFDSFQDFLKMGKHAFFVWTSYGFVVVTWAYLALSPMFQTKSFFKDSIKRQQRQQALQEAEQGE